MSGKLITFYGINNIGKSTHARLLMKRLKKEGLKVSYLKYPVYDLEPTGPFIDKTLRGKDGQQISEAQLQLWFILNRHQFEPQLKKLIEENDIVIAEDYIGTGIAWGIAKGLNKDWLEAANKYLLQEDVAILFEGKRDLRAREATHVHEQNNALTEKCRKVFLKLAKKHSWHRFKMKDRIEDTADALYELVKKFA